MFFFFFLQYLLQKVLKMSMALISSFANWTGKTILCLHTKLCAFSRAAKQIEVRKEQMYPLGQPAILASNHSWLIALIAAKAGLCFLYGWEHALPRLRIDGQWPFKQIKTAKKRHSGWEMWSDNCNACFLSPHKGGQKTEVTAVGLRPTGNFQKLQLNLSGSLCAWSTLGDDSKRGTPPCDKVVRAWEALK